MWLGGCGFGLTTLKELAPGLHIVPPFPLQLTFKRPASHAAVLPVESPVSYNRSKVNIRENLLVAVDHVW